jgi:tRNA modification GTPase
LTQRPKEGGGTVAVAAPGVEAPAQDTIAAIATAAGRGGIGIVRVSGPRAMAIARTIFQRPGESADLKPHHLHYGIIVQPSDQQQLDEVLLAVMPAPASYTREDVVEIQCHGGPVVLQKILELTLHQGARLAEPGEFTRRAFLHGRIDLTQAEAVANLINARSESAMRLATRQMTGGLKQRVEALMEQMGDILAGIEAELEFGEDEATGIAAAHLDSINLHARVIEPMERLVASYPFGNLLREGFRLAIAGRPNVGKSSLLNRLIDQDKAIVTPFPGTTRDPVEACLTIDGVAVTLVDTAGLHESQDPVELLGIQKSREAMQAADLVIFVIEGQQPPDDEDRHIFRQIQASRFILVINKIDLIGQEGAIDLPEAFRTCRPVLLSAKSGEGIDELKRRIGVLWRQTDGMEHSGILCELRHKLAMDDALEACRQAAVGIDECRALDMISMDLKHAQSRLGAIIGRDIEPDVLDAIFKKFCIGK